MRSKGPVQWRGRTDAASSDHPIRVLLLSDSSAIRDSVDLLTGSLPGLEMFTELAGTQAGAAAIRRHRPDVLLIDLKPADVSGITLARGAKAQRRACRVILLTAAPYADAALSRVLSGADRCVFKDQGWDVLIEAIRSEASGVARTVDLAVVETEGAITARLAGGDFSKGSVLPGRARAVLDLILAGASDTEIIGKLQMDEHGIRVAIAQIFRSLMTPPRRT